MRCVVDHEGKWLCGTPQQVPLSMAAPTPDRPLAAAPSVNPPATFAPPAAEAATTTPAAEAASTPPAAAATAPAATTPAEPSTAAQTTAPAPATATTHTVAAETRAAALNPAATPVQRSCPISDSNRQGPMVLSDRTSAPLSIDAEDMEIQGNNLFIYNGKVTMARADQSLLADSARYNHELGTFEAEGNLHYRESGMELQGDRLSLNTNTDSGTLDNASYRLIETGANGDAAQIEMVSRYVNRYHNATYTTCPDSDKSWELQAEQVELDELEGWGSASHALVRFQGVPILYTPGYTFPLDARRKSGVLSPSWGYSKTSGGDISAPYYIHLAPNRDATVTPRLIGKRGIHLSGNFRYLNADNHGEVDASFLPSDDLYNSEDRYQFKINHQGAVQSATLPNSLNYQIDYATLSDKDYLNDLGNTLGLASSDTLEQTATISYSQERWTVSALLSDHYTVDKSIAAANEPYRRLPQIDGSWSSTSANNQFNYSVAGQFVHFDHDTRGGAERYWVKPSVSYNLTLLNEAAYIKPALSVAQSHYSLDNASSSSLTVPHYTLEGGLFFERDASRYLQTLDPKIRLSYIPDGKDSGHTFEVNDNVSSQFYGKDSAPHTKLVTLSVASDLLSNSDGSKLLSTSLERSRDFRSNRPEDWSDLIGKVATEQGSHSAAVQIHLDQYSSRSNTLRADYQYDNDAGQLLNLGYIHERNSKKQLDLSAAWEINSRWSLFARYNQELEGSNRLDYRLEDLIGVSYDSCCWSARFMRRKQLTGDITSNDASPYDTTWFLVLELKGMGRLGKSGPLNQLLEQSIKGYNSEP